MKLLKPSLRDKKRYILLKGSFTNNEVKEIILKYIGILGYSKASPRMVKKNILAINREMLDDVKASFVLTNKINVEKVSGTLKGLDK